MTIKRMSIALAALAAAALLVYAALPSPIEVDLAPVVEGPMQVSVDDQGETRVIDRYTLSAPVAGRLMRIALREGEAVGEGQLLARIAPLPLSTREYDEGSARVAAAEALQREAEERARHAEEDLAQARREHARVLELVADGFVAPQAAEQARNAALTAGIEAEAARFRARAAAADVKVARAALSAARAATGGAAAGGAASGGAASGGAAPFVELRSPVAGSVLGIPDASERVVAAGTPILRVGDTKRLEIVVDLLSSEAVKVKPGMPVRVERWGGDAMLEARVRLVEPFAITKVSALGIEEKRTKVIADFVDSTGPLGDGYRITARIVTWASDKALKAPASGLFRCDHGWCVFAVAEGRAKRTRVEIGHRNPEEAEILEGLAAGQVVIRYPANSVTDGVRVRARS